MTERSGVAEDVSEKVIRHSAACAWGVSGTLDDVGVAKRDHRMLSAVSEAIRVSVFACP